MRMTPERWARVHSLFTAALERGPGERDALLATECGADTELRREVDSLLAVADGAGDYLEAPAAHAVAIALAPGPEDDDAFARRVTAALADRYAVERELGRGGMATVYLARDLRLRRLVALKVLHPHLAATLGAWRFRREIETAANLRHPHVLALHDSGEADGLLYYVMPYVGGESLRDRLRRDRRLPRAEAVRIARELAQALDYAHRRGVIHRDVKPENILLDEGGHSWLADFGIARVTGRTAGEDMTAVGLAIGTAQYMSPEQACGAGVDGRSDVYALGCVLHEMLTGDVPRADGAAPASAAARWLGAALAHVVATATARLPDDRYADAGAFEVAVVHAADARETQADVPGTERRRWRAVRALIGVLASVAVAFAWHSASPNGSASHAQTSSTGEPTREALDPNRVTVYPLVVSGAGATHTAGEDVATAIGSSLDRAGALRWIDGWRLLDARRREDVRGLTSAEAGALARGKHCAYYVSGRVVYRGDSADVFLDLIDAAGDSVVARGKATGTARESWRPGLRAVNGLLPALMPDGNARDLSAGWADREPAAVASFLAGEAAFRRAQPADALTHFRAAVARDSLFGVAAVRGAQAAMWTHREGEARALIDVALRRPLAPRDGHFARGYAAYLAGAADSAAAEFRQALRVDPDRAPAWVQLGEVYTHLLPSADGDADSLAAEAFETARRLDGGAAHLFHLIEIYERRGDTARAAPLVREFLGARPESTMAEQVRAADACVRHGPEAVDWRAAVARNPLAVLSAGKALAAAGAQLPCAEAAYAAVLRTDTTAGPDSNERRWRALSGLQAALLAQGRVEDARAQIEAGIRSGLGGATLFLLGASVTPTFATRAGEVAAADTRAFGAAYERCPLTFRLWHLGVWAAHAGRADLVDAIRQQLEDRARLSREPLDAFYAHSIAVQLPLARGDTLEAIRQLGAIVAEPMPGDRFAWDVAAPRAVERLDLARLLLARGDAARALAVAGAFDSASPFIHLLYVPASLTIRADAAAALGQHALARRLGERLAALRAAPEVVAR